jgi:hypothetical protein
MALMRLYLLKNLLSYVKKMAVIKEHYLGKYKWLDYYKEIISGKTFESLVPPPFVE